MPLTHSSSPFALEPVNFEKDANCQFRNELHHRVSHIVVGLMLVTIFMTNNDANKKR